VIDGLAEREVVTALHELDDVSGGTAPEAVVAAGDAVDRHRWCRVVVEGQQATGDVALATGSSSTPEAAMTSWIGWRARRAS
jgi:hypothetical protein